ncbi:MAG: peptidylprolyl isomerase [Thermoanaerobaculia bacterium]|nr:peptidylprolyl isomerase [Thermoanaerobaculia bacterium]
MMVLPMSRRACARTALGLVVFLLPGCGRESTVASDVAVSIGGEVLTYSEFERYLDTNVGPEGGDLGSETLSRLFDQFLDEQLLVRLAIEGGLVEGGGVDQRRALAYLLRDSAGDWSQAEIGAFYRAHQRDYTRPERVHLRQILAPERSVVEEARLALDQGEDFVQVAARLSKGPKAHLGGDQGILARDDVPTRFVDRVFATEPGKTTDIIDAEYGFLIFQVVERLPQRVVPLEEAEPDVRRRLDEQKVDAQIGSFIQDARERYNVEVFPRNFPFDYQGTYATSD